ncbi:MAG TPA: FHA domain-containing protein [Pirellulales bacterium]|nr:FHA domain-containing protein [Pirellulales bacterium]
MQVKLRIVGGKNAGQELPVTATTFTIGRADGCQLRPRSDAVAERHCELQLEPGRVQVVDLGSATGTFVNDARVSTPRELKAGDTLKVGPLAFEVVIQVALATKKKPKVASVEEAAARMASGTSKKTESIDDWLSGDDEPAAPSRYAAQLSDDEKRALGLGTSEGSPQSAAAQQSAEAEPGSDETRQAAQDVLNKYFKRR